MLQLLKDIVSEHPRKLVVLGIALKLVLFLRAVGPEVKEGSVATDEAYALAEWRGNALKTVVRAGAAVTPEMWANFEAAERAYRAKMPGLIAEIVEAGVVVTMEVEGQRLGAGVKASH